MPQANVTYYTLLNNHLQKTNQVHNLSHHPTLQDGLWTVVISIAGQVFGQGTAAKQNDAKDIAAKQALVKLGVKV